MFAAVQMIGAGRVDDDAVRQAGGDDRGVALQDPEREAVECLGVGRGSGVLNEEARDEDLGPGRRHPHAQAGGLGRGIRRDHHPPSPVMADQDERRLSRRRRVAGRPAHAIC